MYNNNSSQQTHRQSRFLFLKKIVRYKKDPLSGNPPYLDRDDDIIVGECLKNHLTKENKQKTVTNIQGGGIQGYTYG